MLRLLGHNEGKGQRREAGGLPAGADFLSDGRIGAESDGTVSPTGSGNFGGGLAVLGEGDRLLEGWRLIRNGSVVMVAEKASSVGGESGLCFVPVGLVEGCLEGVHLRLGSLEEVFCREDLSLFKMVGVVEMVSCVEMASVVKLEKVISGGRAFGPSNGHLPVCRPRKRLNV